MWIDDLPAPVRASLLGLAVGDAFGNTLGERATVPASVFAARALPPAPWGWTDDTAMALGVLQVLAERGTIDPDRLAAVFAARFEAEPWRGYGGGAQSLLRAVARGMDWRSLAPAMFSGQGSLGNGAAMRAPPLGAWFADDLDRVVSEAARSAAPTHAHPEAAAGAVAVAVAAAVARSGAGPGALYEVTLARTPAGEVRRGIERARELPAGCTVLEAAGALGSGQRVSAPDTVPFVIWAVAQDLDDYEAALWRTAEGGGDRDTTCAMVGGIVGGRLGEEAIPAAWRAATEGFGE